ncbi:MAG: DUF1330 domain-containing protein [bacterium]|nr:DUF1330 domain-containing protein [bacterium]MXV90243.1 DUF1330 domain-containing protein [Acidimicrobiia bacterium]MYC46105.1 DUF1330 domain-containing protein [Acidimicrobiia bacterium]MYI19278.1 DUF1330 domain-containing protein [Acidimicrobiia bacterium]
MAAYLISSIDVIDEDSYEEYQERGMALLENYGGRYLVSGGDVKLLRGDWRPRRLILVEFDSADDIEAMFASDEFVNLRELASGAIEGTLIQVEGV